MMGKAKGRFWSACLTIVLGNVLILAPGPVYSAELLFGYNFDGPDGLITDEFAFYNSSHSNAVKSSVGDVTAGRLEAINGAGFTSSPIFRLITKQEYLDASVALAILNDGLFSTARTPELSHDGVHIFLRYQGEANCSRPNHH